MQKDGEDFRLVGKPGQYSKSQRRMRLLRDRRRMLWAASTRSGLLERGEGGDGGVKNNVMEVLSGRSGNLRVFGTGSDDDVHKMPSWATVRLAREKGFTSQQAQLNSRSTFFYKL